MDHFQAVEYDLYWMVLPFLCNVYIRMPLTQTFTFHSQPADILCPLTGWIPGKFGKTTTDPLCDLFCKSCCCCVEHCDSVLWLAGFILLEAKSGSLEEDPKLTPPPTPAEYVTTLSSVVDGVRVSFWPVLNSTECCWDCVCSWQWDINVTTSDALVGTLDARWSCFLPPFMTQHTCGAIGLLPLFAIIFLDAENFLRLFLSAASALLPMLLWVTVSAKLGLESDGDSVMSSDAGLLLWLWLLQCMLWLFLQWLLHTESSDRLLPINLLTRPDFAASISVPQRRLWEDDLLIWSLGSRPKPPRWVWWSPFPPPPVEELLLLGWWWWWDFFGVEPAPTLLPNMADVVEPKISWRWCVVDTWCSWCCCKLAINSATVGSWLVPDGAGAMLKPFIRRRSFWRFFFPPAPVNQCRF